MTKWEPKAHSWDDIEGVHRVRVAFRRMRSVLRLFRTAIPREASQSWSEEMRWLSGQLGNARDLDVLINETLAPALAVLPLPGGEQLQGLAEQRRAGVYAAEVVPMLNGERFQRFKEDFPAWIANRGWEQMDLEKKYSKRLQAPILTYSRTILDKQERRVAATGVGVDREDAVAMHRLRIECKKLRYAADFFKPLFDGMETYIAHMKGLQDLLGVMNDIALTKGLLDELLSDCQEGDASRFAGGVTGWQVCHFRQLLERFDDDWNKFTAAKRPWRTPKAKTVK